jgi:8-oxo-dGTP diphosphatase
MRTTKTVLTNMCMICEGEQILVQDKINSSYTGVTFPGGHVEAGETLSDAMVREVYELLQKEMKA